MSHVMTITDLHDADRVRRTCVGSPDPVFISDGDKEEMVLLDMNLYRQLYAKLQVYQKLEEGERDIAAGRVVNGYDAVNRIWGTVHV